MSERQVDEYVDRFKLAEAYRLIDEWYYCCSPNDTPADTRYVFRAKGGDMRVLPHYKIGGYLDGLGV